MSLQDDVQRLADEQRHAAALQAGRERELEEVRGADVRETRKLAIEFAVEARRLGIPTQRLRGASGLPWNRKPAVRGWIVREEQLTIDGYTPAIAVTETGNVEGWWKDGVPRYALAAYLAQFT